MHPSFFQRLLRGRLIKFCLVGLSSTVIDKVIFYALMKFVPTMPWFVSQSIAFIFGVTNGFIWNRKWTFATTEHDSRRRQYPKFVATNLVGLILNLVITKGFLVIFLGTARPSPAAFRKEILIASLCAVPIVVIWNFSASRLWTFKSVTPKAPPAAGIDSSAPIAPPQ